MKTVDVEIKFDGTVDKDSIEQDIKEAILELVGGGVEVTIVDIVVDEDGTVSVVVRVDEQTAQTLIDAINNNNNNKDWCVGVLCRATQATSKEVAETSQGTCHCVFAVLVATMLFVWFVV